MKQFHAVAGLMRSGSTLLCNVLNQNPDFHASDTSRLSEDVSALSAAWSSSPEVKSALINSREGTEARMLSALRGLIDGWYSGRDEGVVFDKGRGWIVHLDRLASLYPETRVLCCVRDLRDVIASVTRRQREFPVLDGQQSMTLIERVADLMTPQGMVGGPLRHIEDRLLRESDNLYMVVFEKFVQDPERELRKIYGELKIDWWSGHDFDDVVDCSTDVDGLYLNKFPHGGSGKVRPPDRRWQDDVPEAVAQQVMSLHPAYNQRFGYR